MERGMHKFVSLKDFQTNAKQKLSISTFGYFSSGANDQITLKQNQQAFDKIYINPRILINVQHLNLKKKILGVQCDLPFGFSPSAMQKLAHPQGEAITALVACEQKLCFALSTLSTVSLQQILKKNPTGLKLLQLYINKNRKITQTLIKLAQQYLFRGLVVTVDAQIIGKRINDQKNKFLSPQNIKFEILEQVQRKLQNKDSKQNIQRKSFANNRDLSLSWDFISWIKSFTKLPIILKGVCSVEDVALACKYKVDAIWISNHGGRQLDTIRPTIQILPQITRFIKKNKLKIQVFIDGGVRKGTDIFKCLALGADYVFIGRPLVYSLIEGYPGVKHAVKILKQQLSTTMRLSGIKNISEITDKYIISIRSRL